MRLSPTRISSGPKPRRRSSAGALRLPAQDGDLRALSKTELLALVSELRAGRAADAAREAGGPKPAASLFLTESVRSGQTIEFPEGDVVVIGSVGSGAEIVAGGSIHVYGALRGRAVAGTPGNAGAHLLPEPAGGAPRHRRPLPPGRESRPEPPGAPRPGSARWRRNDARADGLTAPGVHRDLSFRMPSLFLVMPGPEPGIPIPALAGGTVA
jgi:Septum formation inhibitor MinC, C-terminal domain